MPQRILLSVEDDYAQFRIMRIALEETALAVQLYRVSDGEEALSFLKNVHGYELAPRPDLILLDLNLPKKGGFDVLREIRANESFRSIPIVMFTAFSLATEKSKALALGAQDYIWKPMTFDEFVRTLRFVYYRFLEGGRPLLVNSRE